MRRLLALAVLLLILDAACMAQKPQIRIFLTGRSNVSSAEVGKSLDSHCPDVVVTADPEKADYLLEAIDTGVGAARKPYKFTLFDRVSDRVFSTETARVDSAVKDVCVFIHKAK